MDIDDYQAMLCAIDTTRNLREPFEKRAQEIASKIMGLHHSEVMSISFGESKVTYTWEEGWPESNREELVANFPVEWLFDANWEEKHKAENETKRKAWDERMKNYAELEWKQKEDRERAEFDRLKKKYGV